MMPDIIYDARPDLDAFYGMLNSPGATSTADPADVYQTLDRLAGSPDATLKALGLGPALMSPAQVRDEFTEQYYARVAEEELTPVEALEREAADVATSRVALVANRTGVSVFDVEAAEVEAACGNPFDYDRIMSMYYNS